MHFFVVKLFKKYFKTLSKTPKIMRPDRHRWCFIKAAVFLSIILPACHLKKNKKIVPAPAQQNPAFVCYRLAIKGIECKECIRSIIRNLHKSKLCAYIECQCPKKDLSQAQIACFIDHDKFFPLQKIKELVSTEHFRLSRITGTYNGILSEKDQQLLFTPEETDLVLTIVRDARYNHLLPITSASTIALYGTIDLDSHLFIVQEKPYPK